MKFVVQVYIGDVLAKLLLAVAALILIRGLSPTEYASYTLAFALVGLASQALSASVNRVYVLMRGTEDTAFVGAQFLTMQVCVILAAAVAGSSFASGRSKVYWCAFAVLTSVCCLEFAKTYFQRRMEFRQFITVEVFRGISCLVGIALLAFFCGRNLRAWHVLLVQAVATALVFAVAIAGRLPASAFKGVGQAARVLWQMVMGRHGLLLVYFILISCFVQMDILTLKAWSDVEQLATYGSAFRYYAMLMLGLNAMHTVLLPMARDLGDKSGYQAFRRMHIRSLMAFVPLVACAMMACGWVIPWVDRGLYPDAPIVFRILAVSSIVSMASSPFVNILLAKGDYEFMVVAVLLGLAGYAGLATALVPSFGAIGAALTTLIACGLLNCLVFVRARTRNLSRQSATIATVSN